jgi:hypothetical protein
MVAQDNELFIICASRWTPTPVDRPSSRDALPHHPASSMTAFATATSHAVGSVFEWGGGDNAFASPVHHAADDVSP